MKNRKTATLPQLCKFLLTHLEEMEDDGGAWGYPNFPEFDLYARDYLSYAEVELQNYKQNNKPSALINCISHLKRAADCQLDTLLTVLDLNTLINNRNLGFDKKLLFLSACGIFRSRTLARLNSLRNRMEHQYEVPRVDDIEAYFDLVTAFVAVLESESIGQTELDYFIGEKDKDYHAPGRVQMQYSQNPPLVEAEWHMNEAAWEYSRTTEDLNEFTRAFRIFRLMRQMNNFASLAWTLSEIEKTMANQELEATSKLPAVSNEAPDSEPHL